ncbi:MAG: hypothetical protein HZA29_04850 [Candidatus Omnitrophica bacterium]|nr:hypothetical protein [Candidatus Omnitrophota bacterium]
MLAILLLAFGVVSRLVVHLPNFTPVIALALFGGVYLKKNQAIVLPVLMMMVADVFLGLHDTILFTWGAVAVVAVLGLWARKNKSVVTIAGSSLLSAVLFFLITNFGVWLVSGMYAHTPAGLWECFVLAVPFFGNTLSSTVIYTAVLFGAYEWAARQVQNTRLAHIVL